MQSRLLTIGFLLIFIFILGFWLRHTGKPYSVIILTLHKLASLGAVVLLGVTLYGLHRAASLSPLVVGLAVAAAVCALAAIATGGLLSTGRVLPLIVLRLHQVAPYALAFSLGATYYLLLVEERLLGTAGAG